MTTEREKALAAARAIERGLRKGHGFNMEWLTRNSGIVARALLAADAPAEGTRAAVEFARHIISTYAWGREVDGGDVQEMAVSLGLLVEVPYDPAKHGENDCDVEPGDPWFVFSGALAAASPRSTPWVCPMQGRLSCEGREVQMIPPLDWPLIACTVRECPHAPKLQGKDHG